MASEVLFFKIEDKSKVDLEKIGEKVFETFADFFDVNDRLAIKTHFGEPKNTTSPSPKFIKAIYKKLEPVVGQIALVDCNVLYKGERTNATSHKNLAIKRGFDFGVIDILDGEIGQPALATPARNAVSTAGWPEALLAGEYEVEIPVVSLNGQAKHFKTAKIGKGLEKYNAILAISHFKGHMACGIGGAIKNIGMGLGSRAGKLAMHKAFRLEVDSAKCAGCGLCQKECPNNAIEIINQKATINYSKCLGCAKCLAICPNSAFLIPWHEGVKDIQEKIGEYALAALAGKKALFVNLLIDITRSCDCMNENQTPFLGDIGILISKDPVAIDQASLDLAGKENFTKGGAINPEAQIVYGQAIGLGKKEYTLKIIN
ncbi:MAG: DUF362 domain-containing protein [bacterium]